MPTLRLLRLLPKWRAMPALRSFTKIGFRRGRGGSASPIGGVCPLRYIPMERGIRPIAHLCDVAMLDRIPMDVINMVVEIVLVADLMLPKSPLPNRTFPMLFSGRIHPRLLME